jgi:hypothetical protein
MLLWTQLMLLPSAHMLHQVVLHLLYCVFEKQPAKFFAVLDVSLVFMFIYIYIIIIIINTTGAAGGATNYRTESDFDRDDDSDDSSDDDTGAALPAHDEPGAAPTHDDEGAAPTHDDEGAASADDDAGATPAPLFPTCGFCRKASVSSHVGGVLL